MRSHASATVRTGCLSKDSRIDSRNVAISLSGRLGSHRRRPSNPPSRNAATNRCTVARPTPMISAAFWRVTPLCNNQSTSIRSRIRSLGWAIRSSLTTRCSSSVNCTRSQAMVHLLALRLDRDQHPCRKPHQSTLSAAETKCLSQGRAEYKRLRLIPFEKEPAVGKEAKYVVRLTDDERQS